MSTILWVRSSSKGELLPQAQPANVSSNGLPLHWPVWPRDTEGCEDHGGALLSEGRALLAPARAASYGEPTPAPTHPVAGCSGYVDALEAKSKDHSAKLFGPLSSQSHSTAAGPSSGTPFPPHPAQELKGWTWALQRQLARTPTL